MNNPRIKAAIATPQNIDASRLKSMFNDGTELALLDVREAGQFGESHLLFATPLPYSRLEMDVSALVPRKSATVVLCDDGKLGVAALAAQRLLALGYTNIAVLEGGTVGWAAAGYALFAGVNVPSKAFGELVEHAYRTPRITPQELIRMRQSGEDFVVLDGRPFSEYHKLTIPGSTCCPNAELPYRIASMIRNPATKIIVNCAGRTRSIIGAQTLINFGVENPVYALENGTQGWVLSGYQLEYGSLRKYPDQLDAAALPAQQEAARKLMRQFSVRTVAASQVEAWMHEPDRTTYICDVRTPEEFAAGSVAGAVHAPGGQLVQATDQWVGVRNARVVLIDSECVRAPVVATWLKQLGCDVYVMEEGIGAALTIPAQLAPALPVITAVSAPELKHVIDTGNCTVIDLGSSMNFRKAHIPGSRWSIRPRIVADARNVTNTIVLVADPIPNVALLAASELMDAGIDDVKVLEGGLAAWRAAGYTTESTPLEPSDPECIDYLFFVHDRHAGNRAAMQQYLDWETGLLAQLDAQDRDCFRVGTAF